MTLDRVAVHIGDVKVAGEGATLLTIGLGSCVAIALYDPRTKVGGLAHAMLPSPSNARQDVPPGRFATTAVPQLVELMKDAGASRRRIRARLAGGASMFRDLLEGDGLKLGRRNVEAAREALAKLDIPIDGEDVFGSYGRSVYLDTADGRLLVTSVRNPDVVL